jgi:hypothetical protein
MAALLSARILAAMRRRINSGRARNRRWIQGIVDFRAKRQITSIVGAEGVAVHNQHVATVEVEHLFFRQQRHAAFAGKALANEKIAVAVEEVAGDAGIDQRFDGRGYLPMQWGRIVIANPEPQTGRRGYIARPRCGLPL